MTKSNPWNVDFEDLEEAESNDTPIPGTLAVVITENGTPLPAPLDIAVTNETPHNSTITAGQVGVQIPPGQTGGIRYNDPTSVCRFHVQGFVWKVINFQGTEIKVPVLKIFVRKVLPGGFDSVQPLKLGSDGSLS